MQVKAKLYIQGKLGKHVIEVTMDPEHMSRFMLGETLKAHFVALSIDEDATEEIEASEKAESRRAYVKDKNDERVIKPRIVRILTSIHDSVRGEYREEPTRRIELHLFSEKPTALASRPASADILSMLNDLADSQHNDDPAHIIVNVENRRFQSEIVNGRRVWFILGARTSPEAPKGHEVDYTAIEDRLRQELDTTSGSDLKTDPVNAVNLGALHKIIFQMNHRHDVIRLIPAEGKIDVIAGEHWVLPEVIRALEKVAADYVKDDKGEVTIDAGGRFSRRLVDGELAWYVERY